MKDNYSHVVISGVTICINVVLNLSNVSITVREHILVIYLR